MKKLLIFILLAAGAYFAYEYLLKDKTVLEINADKSITTEHSMDIDAPAIITCQICISSGNSKKC